MSNRSSLDFEAALYQERASFLQSVDVAGDLNQQAVHGGALKLFSRMCIFVLNLGSLMILARLLSPSDYGLVGMVGALVAFVALFNDLGLSTATVQTQSLKQEQVSTLFWLNLGLGSGVAFLTFFLAPAVAWFCGGVK